MAQKSLSDLLKPVADATEAGRLKWQKDGPNGFVAELPSYKIHAWQGEDETGFRFVSASLRNREGEELDHLSSDEFQSGYDRLRDFLKIARRSALNFDRVADDVLSELTRLAS